MFQMEPYHIVLADDHLMFRQGVKKILEEHDDLKVVGEANDGIELLDLLKKITPDVVILDISMPNIRGIEATKEIKMTAPEIKVVILTMHKSKEYLYHCLKAGAQGYLLKEDADTELYTAIKKVIEGDFYISPILSEALRDDFVQICLGDQKLAPELLTSRLREVTKLIAEG